MSTRKRATPLARCRHAATFLAPTAKVGHFDLAICWRQKEGKKHEASEVCGKFADGGGFQPNREAKRNGRVGGAGRSIVGDGIGAH